jgi:hypothetical protein
MEMMSSNSHLQDPRVSAADSRGSMCMFQAINQG